MKQIILLMTLLSLSIVAETKPQSVVSILPQKVFVEKIAGDRLPISVMVAPGDSPHTYEPKPSQMRQIAQADLYFAIGVEFEHVWLPKFTGLNPHLTIIDLTQGIERLPMVAHHHHEAEADHHDDEEADGRDPHIWTSPANVAILSQHIAKALIAKDPSHASLYQERLAQWLQEINATDQKIRTILSTLPKGTKFMVFHPSWGYFAKAYDLVQLPVEVEGKSPKPKALIRLIKEARRNGVRAIFTQPEFSDSAAKIIAKELGIPVIKVSPMAPNWSENLIKIAKAIAGKS